MDLRIKDNTFDTLPFGIRTKLIQETERRALNFAIQEKRLEIKDLKSKWMELDTIDQSLLYPPNDHRTKQHGVKLTTKLEFLKKKTDVNYSDWPDSKDSRKRSVPINRNENSKVEGVSNVDRKLRRRRSKRSGYARRKCTKIAQEALESHSIINLIPKDKLEIPNEAIAVLVKGGGFVPTPKFDRDNFRIDSLNCSTRLANLTTKK